VCRVAMTPDRTRGFCPRCRHQQIFERTRIHHGVHLALTVLTCGLWSVSWISSYIGYRLRPWRCQQCHWHKPIFDLPNQKKKAPETHPVDGP